jgi:hypothetical protein
MNEKYVIKNLRDGKCLNNIGSNLGKLIYANFINEESPTVLTFSSEGDANTLCERIVKRLRIPVEAVLYNT